MAAVVALGMGSGTAAANPTVPAAGALDVQGMLEKLLREFNVPNLPNVGDAVVDTKQMIVMSVPTKSSPTGTLTAFEKDDNGKWLPVPEIGPVAGHVGELGIGEPKDSVRRTPEGTFGFDQAFGRLDNPGTKMPYKKVDNQDWWVSNLDSPDYNKMVRQPNDPGGGSENLYNMGPSYDYAVNIAHNPGNVKGKATAMFLHVDNGAPTWGCVSIPLENMKKVLQWMDPAKNPKITIGVNAAAPKEGEALPSTVNPEGKPLDSNALTGILGEFTKLIPELLGGDSGSTGDAAPAAPAAPANPTAPAPTP